MNNGRHDDCLSSHLILKTQMARLISGEPTTERNMMRYRTFGRQTGLRVSELALGTGSFGTRWGYGAEPDEAKSIFDSYVKGGGNFIDTSQWYQSGQSEELLGDFIAADRDHFVVASKYTLGTERVAGVSRNGNSRKSMVSAIEGSLKRLKT